VPHQTNRDHLPKSMPIDRAPQPGVLGYLLSHRTHMVSDRWQFPHQEHEGCASPSNEGRNYLFPDGVKNVGRGSTVMSRHTYTGVGLWQNNPELPIDAVHAPRLVPTAQPRV
jgi:hypothetical protein